jgi:3-methyladenine DNA glycosylase AlkC
MIRPPEIPNAPRAIQKGVPLKYIIDESAINCLALNIYYVYRAFDVEQFCKACTQGLEPLSLMERAKHVAKQLRQFLPERYSDALAVLVESLTLEEPFSEEFSVAEFFYLSHNFFISEYGLSAEGNGGSDPFESSMSAIYELTKRFTAEFAIRNFIIEEQKKTLSQLRRWVLDENPHVRRLCSEGTRPKLPWAKRIKAFIADPQLTIFFLETLKDDDSLYVRRSVANHLGDIAKDHPETVYSICSNWLAQNATAEVKWVIRHALRYPAKKQCNRAIEIRLSAK